MSERTNEKASIRTVAIVAVLAASTLFGTSAAMRGLAGMPGTPVSVAAWRVCLGGLVLAAYALWRYGPSGMRKLFRKPVLWLMGAACLGYQLAFFYGAAKTGVAFATLGALSLASISSGILSHVLGTGKITRVWMISTAVALLGLSFLTGVAGTLDVKGITAFCLSGATYAVVLVNGTRIGKELKVTGQEVLATAFGIGALFALPIVLTTSSWVQQPKDFALIIYLGVFTTALAYIFFGLGMSHLPPATVSTLNLFEPVTSTSIGVFLLAEPMTGKGWVGCLLIILAIGFLGIFDGRTSQNERVEIPVYPSA